MSNEPGVGTRAAQLAQLAAKAAKIAAAASAGGLYGAAVETVKQFLPQFIKITVITLVIVLLLPVLIFAGIPHFLFGWLGSGDADIISMTDKATQMGGVYSRYDDMVKQAAELLAADLTGPNEDLHAEVNIHLGSMSVTWLAAIISVYYEQNLNVIDESYIQQMIADSLIFTSGAIGESKILFEIFDIDPVTLMDKLGFTEDQRKWAEVLVGSMSEDQTLTADDADYIAHYNVDYSGITFTDGKTEVVYFNQLDSRWADTPYGQTGTIGRSGCRPTAMSIVVSTLTGKTVSPVEMSDWAARNGYYVEGVGSRHSLIPDAAKKYGLSVEGIGKDAQKIVDALADGKLVVAIMSKGHFTSRGHFIVLRGVTEDGLILVADPASKTRSEQLWDLEIILNEANRNAGAGGPFWAVG